MTTLTITKAYSAGAALMESHIDNFRTGLHTLFNTDKLSSGNFSGAMALTASKFTGSRLLTADNTDIDFGGSNDASWGIDSSKVMFFSTAASTTEIQLWAGATYYVEFFSDKVNVPGDITITTGNADYSLCAMIGTYKKPRLEWAGASYVRVQCNHATSTSTTIVFPSFVATVDEAATGSAKFRVANISNTANGYGTSHTGAASGGRRSGVSLTTNSWYYVYACKVRSGTDYSATTAKFVLVYDTTSPSTSNSATLDGYYGADCWVYLGVIRYGFGATGNSSSIPKFTYSNKGWCYFFEASTSGYGGLNLAYSTTDADNTSSPFYTLAEGTSGNVIPSIVSAVSLQLTRENVSDWYIKESSSGDIFWRGGWQTADSTVTHGFQVELPLDGDALYAIYQARKGNGAVARAVTLVGFCDGFIGLRRHGHGI